MAVGVKFRNGNDITVINNETSIIAINGERSLLSRKAGAGNLPPYFQFPNNKNELIGFKLLPTHDSVTFKTAIGLDDWYNPDTVSTVMSCSVYTSFNSLNYYTCPTAVWIRSIKPSEFMGKSSATFGLRLFKDTKVTFDSGYIIPNMHNITSFNRNTNYTIPDNSYIFPIVAGEMGGVGAWWVPCMKRISGERWRFNPAYYGGPASDGNFIPNQSSDIPSVSPLVNMLVISNLS